MAATKPAANNAPKGILTRQERIRLMADTSCDERTIRRWERGETVKDATRRRLEQAAKKHGIVVPKKP